MNVDKTDPRARTGLIVLFGVLLVTLTIYAMVTSNQPVLDEVLELVRYGLSAALGFEVGRARLQSRSSAS